MSLGRLLVLIAGVCGVVAFFLPIYEGNPDGHRVHVSGYRIVTGIESLHEVTDHPIADSETEEDVRKANEMFRENAWVFWVVFAPGAVLLAVALLSSLTGYGRWWGVLALVTGLLATGLWILVNQAFAKIDEPFERGAAMPLLLATGIGGALGGLLGLVRPERRAVLPERLEPLPPT